MLADGMQGHRAVNFWANYFSCELATGCLGPIFGSKISILLTHPFPLIY